MLSYSLLIKFLAVLDKTRPVISIVLDYASMILSDVRRGEMSLSISRTAASFNRRLHRSVDASVSR